MFNQSDGHSDTTLNRELVEQKGLIGHGLQSPRPLEAAEIPFGHPELQEAFWSVLGELKLNFSRELQTKNQLLTAHLGEGDPISLPLQQCALTEIGNETAEAFVISEHLPELIDTEAGAQLNSQTSHTLGQMLDGLLDRLLLASGCSLKGRQGVGEVQP